MSKMLAFAREQGAKLIVVRGSMLELSLVHDLPAEYIQGSGTVRVGELCCARAAAHKQV